MSISVEITGVAEVENHLRRVMQQMITASPPALIEEGNRIMGTSQALVPVLTGLLKSTGQVKLFDAYQATVVELSYGMDGTAFYAALVHEDTSMNHPRGGQAFYLSEPFFAATAGMAARLAASIRAQMGG